MLGNRYFGASLEVLLIYRSCNVWESGYVAVAEKSDVFLIPDLIQCDFFFLSNFFTLLSFCSSSQSCDMNFSLIIFFVCLY